MTSVRTTLSTKHFLKRTEDLRQEALIRGRPVGFVLGIIQEEVDDQDVLPIIKPKPQRAGPSDDSD